MILSLSLDIEDCPLTPECADPCAHIGTYAFKATRCPLTSGCQGSGIVREEFQGPEMYCFCDAGNEREAMDIAEDAANDQAAPVEPDSIAAAVAEQARIRAEMAANDARLAALNTRPDDTPETYQAKVTERAERRVASARMRSRLATLRALIRAFEAGATVSAESAVLTPAGQLLIECNRVLCRGRKGEAIVIGPEDLATIDKLRIWVTRLRKTQDKAQRTEAR